MEHISKLAPATIRDYSNIVKAIVASAVNAQGDELFARTWKEEFIDTPIVQYQRQPSTDKAEMEAILKEATCQNRMLYALLADAVHSAPARRFASRSASMSVKTAARSTFARRRSAALFSPRQRRRVEHRSSATEKRLAGTWISAQSWQECCGTLLARAHPVFCSVRPTPASKYAPGQPSSHPEED